MSNLFADLQRLTLNTEMYTIDNARKKLNRIVDFFKNREEYLQLVTIFAEVERKLDVQTLLDADSFMCQHVEPIDLPEDLRHDSLGFCRGSRLVFDGRYVYPVKDPHGDVMGFCGYDKFSEVKYLDSDNYGYKAKRYSLWGMERMREYYSSSEPVFFVEGIVCALYLRQCGLQSLAYLGSTLSPYGVEILKRFGSRAVVVADSDHAGDLCRKFLNRKVPSIRVVQSAVAKDVDDSRIVCPYFADELYKMKNMFYRSEYFY